MAGIQFGQIVYFSLTLHTWELLVTSEVERKMILLGHPISSVVYYQWQGHFTIMCMCCSASLFLILNKRTLRSFGTNTSVYKHVPQIVRNFGYWFLISKILICPLPERIQKVWIVFSHVVRRDTLYLRRYDYLIMFDFLILCAMCFVAHPFSTTKLLTKISFFINRKGPRTHVIVYSSFVKQQIDSKKAGELI